jgi:SHS2 domain-containing protein
MDQSTINNQEEPFIEEIEHTADWAIRVKGKTIEALFENAALGMLHLIQTTSKLEKMEIKTIELNAIDDETLLVTWLEEILFHLETSEVTFSKIDVQSVKDGFLKAVVHEERLDNMKKEIKAVTFSDLKIEATNEGLVTTIVFDV